MATIPGDCHIQCRYDWSRYENDIPKDVKGTREWFAFPFNFDPIWGPDQCVGYTTEEPTEKVSDGPLLTLLGILGNRF